MMTGPGDGSSEFQEIAHCGGQVTFRVHTDEKGRRTIQFGIRHSRPTAAAWFAMYALPEGIPVGMIEMRGMGQPWNPPPVQGCIPVFIASDSEARFGHRCGYCRGYWRSNGVPSRWPMTCPYCGNRNSTQNFLTQGQIQYVEEYCRRAADAYASADGEYLLDMDEVASVAGTDAPKPRFYYAEERQQNRFSCTACGAFNDILGRYAYCSTCGSHNGLSELEKDLKRIDERIAAGTDVEGCVKDSVSAFDSMARKIAKQLARNVPMTDRRKKDWKRRFFHNLGQSRDDLRSVFDIDLYRNVSVDDQSFAELMFHRRHVYEHNGGEVDKKYIQDSGDTSVRPNQRIHETKDSATRLVSIIRQLAGNLLAGFNGIFPPEEMALSGYTRRRAARGAL
jgi:hypothetical protein